MSEFQPPPLKVLDQQQTLDFLKLTLEELHTLDMELGGMGKWRVKSQWLCDLLDEREKAAGFQYNALFQHWFEKEFNVGPFDENGSTLSLLIYNAQRFRRHDRIVREGWRPGSQELLREALQKKAKIRILGSTLLGREVSEVLNVKEVNGKLYAARPKARRYAYAVEGKPIKIEEGETPCGRQITQT